jgi:hypothetical protein
MCAANAFDMFVVRALLSGHGGGVAWPVELLADECPELAQTYTQCVVLCARTHTHLHRFVSSFKSEWQLDREMIIIMMCIALFAPTPTLFDRDGVTKRRRAYLQLLIGFVAAPAPLAFMCVCVCVYTAA